MVLERLGRPGRAAVAGRSVHRNAALQGAGGRARDATSRRCSPPVVRVGQSHTFRRGPSLLQIPGGSPIDFPLRRRTFEPWSSSRCLSIGFKLQSRAPPLFLVLDCPH